MNQERRLGFQDSIMACRIIKVSIGLELFLGQHCFLLGFETMSSTPPLRFSPNRNKDTERFDRAIGAAGIARALGAIHVNVF